MVFAVGKGVVVCVEARVMRQSGRMRESCI